MTSARKLLGTGAIAPVAFVPQSMFTASEPGAHFEAYNPEHLLVRRNRLTYSEQLDNAAWTKASTTISANVDGTADKIVEAAATAVHTVSQASASADVLNVVSARIKPDGRTWVYITLGTATAFFNLTGANGVLGTVAGGLTAAITAASGAAGYYDITLSGVPASTAMLIGLSTDGVVTSYLGVITNGVIVARAHVDWNTAVATAYQLVTDWSTEHIAAAGAANVGMWQDSAGTIATSLVEQPVGKWGDWRLGKGAAGNHATQATAGSRPILSARYNLLTKSEQFDNAFWAKVNATVTANVAATLDPLGGNTADKLIATAVLGQHRLDTGAVALATPMVYTVWAKAAEYSFIWIRVGTSGVITSLIDGTMTALTGGWTATTENVGNGWWKTRLTGTPAAGDVARANVVAASTGADFTGDGVSGIYLGGADLRTANDAALRQPAYQRVNTSADYDSAGFVHYLKFDGADDFCATPAIDFSGVNKVSVWVGLTKLSDAAAGIAVELTAASDANNGAFAIAAPAAIAANFGVQMRGTVVANAAGYDPATYAANLTKVVTAQFDLAGADRAAAVIPHIDGTLDQGEPDADALNAGGNFANAVLYIGRRGGTTVPFNGRMTSLTVRGSTAKTPVAMVHQAQQYAARLAGQSFTST